MLEMSSMGAKVLTDKICAELVYEKQFNSASFIINYK